MEISLKDDRTTDTSMLELEELVSKNKKFKQIHAAITTLKMKYQAAISLRYLEEKSILEIAEILKLSQNTVKTHIRRGLLLLRDRL